MDGVSLLGGRRGEIAGKNEGGRIELVAREILGVLGLEFVGVDLLAGVLALARDLESRLGHIDGDDVTGRVAEVVAQVSHDAGEVLSRHATALSGHARGAEDFARAGGSMKAVENDHRETLGFTGHPGRTHESGVIRTVALRVRTVATIALGRKDFGTFGGKS